MTGPHRSSEVLPFTRCPSDRVGNLMDSLDVFATDALVQLEAQALRRHMTPTERCGGVEVIRNRRRLISFSCNDYLGLAHDPRVKAAAVDALERYGAGGGASRLVTGDYPLIEAWRRGSPPTSARPQPWCSAPAISPMSRSRRR